VVSRSYNIIADFVHNVHDIFALGQRSDCVALNRIACINERNIIVRFSQCFFVRCKPRIADILVNAAVNIACA